MALTRFDPFRDLAILQDSMNRLFKNGVLSVRLPFREEAKPRSIKVDVAA